MVDEETLRLVKPYIDVCLFTDDASRLLGFWRDQIGLTTEDPIKIREGLIQHRLTCGGSVIKISEQSSNLARAELSGYRELLIASEEPGAPLRTMSDPDGNRVTLVPPGALPAGEVGIRMHVRDVAATQRFFESALCLPISDGPDASIVIGNSRLFLVADPAAAVDLPVNAFGWRYITLQVFDARAVYQKAISRGAGEGVPPRTLGTIARYALVRDPDANWIELTQRASLTGPLGPD